MLNIVNSIVFQGVYYNDISVVKACFYILRLIKKKDYVRKKQNNFHVMSGNACFFFFVAGTDSQ